MSEMKTSLLVSPGGDGWFNLAAEEFLVDSTGPEDAVIYLFINTNAVIIGRNQNPWAECRLKKMEEDGVQLVRRISGGGAVYHDLGNINFSFIMGKERYDLRKQMEIICSAVRSMGIECVLSGRNDITAGGRKFSGNAFCERAQAKMHHGTLLISTDLEKLQEYLNVDPAKLESKGIRSVRSRVCNLSEFDSGITTEKTLNILRQACFRAYGECREIGVDDLDERDLEKYVRKHSSAEWLTGRTPRFDYEIKHRFVWGSVQVLLRLCGGRVDSLDVFSDANDILIREKICRCLVGAEFGSAPLAEALCRGDDPRLEDLAEYIITLEL